MYLGAKVFCELLLLEARLCFFQIQKGGIRMQEWVAYFSYFNDTITFHLTSVQLEKIERLCID